MIRTAAFADKRQMVPEMVVGFIMVEFLAPIGSIGRESLIPKLRVKLVPDIAGGLG